MAHGGGGPTFLGVLAGVVGMAFCLVLAISAAKDKRAAREAQARYRQDEADRKANERQQLLEQRRRDAIAALEACPKLTFELVDDDGVITTCTLHVTGWRPRLKRIECIEPDTLRRVDLLLRQVLKAHEPKTGRRIDLAPFLKDIRTASAR